MKSIVKFFNYAILMLVFCGVVVCINGCNENYTPIDEETIQAQKDFNMLLDKIDELEILSYRYNKEDYIDRVCIYIRCEKYNTQEWNSLGGEIDQYFENYVFQNQTKNVYSLKTLNSFTIPSTKESVDFVHLFATLNILLKTDSVPASCDLSGWGGDIMQLASSIKDCNETGSGLYAYIKAIFNSKNGAFNAEDVCADIDAVNLANILKQNNTSIKENFISYYKNISRENVKTNFIQNVFGDIYSSLSSLQEDMYAKVTKNNLLIYWGMKNNFNIKDTRNAEILKTCCDVFAEYLFNN